MCFFDGPIGRCEAVHEMVMIDQTQRECALEHGCPPDRDCPLDGCFAQTSGLLETAVPLTHHRRKLRAARASPP